jgi:uncharacterized cysteine cluster protein YcgN (CxxCxxCC family)
MQTADSVLMPQPDFLHKPMHEMSEAEWESLCDGCGLCCQIRIEDGTTGRISLSNIACRYLCLNSHRCTDYANRHHNVPDCMTITPQNVHALDWLPYSCSYRLVAKGYDLPEWHHLVCGDPERVHTEGPSMRDETISEDEVDWRDYGIVGY